MIKRKYNGVYRKAKKIDETNLDLDNKIKLIKLKIFYKKGKPNEGEYTDLISAVKALIAFSEV
jgi:hypothetical protein